MPVPSDIASTLPELGYFPVPGIYGSIKVAIEKSLKSLGDSCADALTFHICENLKIPKTELASNYLLFERSLRSILGNGADLIIYHINKNLIEEAGLKMEAKYSKSSTTSSPSDGKVASEVQKQNICQFMRAVPPRSHLALLYSDLDFHDRVMTEFLEGAGGKFRGGLLSSKPTKLQGINNLLYNELFSDKSNVREKLGEWVSKLSTDKNNHARIVDEDSTQWFKKGFSNELMGIEESLGIHLNDNLSILCAYDISSMDKEKGKSDNHESNRLIRKIVKSHGYVILDRPYMVYRTKGEVA